MALSTALPAQTTEATSDAISLTGPIEIRAFGLSEGEQVVVQWETLTGFETAKSGAGPVVLTKQHPSTIYVGYSDIKIYKPVTENAVSVGYAQ